MINHTGVGGGAADLTSDLWPWQAGRTYFHNIPKVTVPAAFHRLYCAHGCRFMVSLGERKVKTVRSTILSRKTAKILKKVLAVFLARANKNYTL